MFFVNFPYQSTNLIPAVCGTLHGCWWSYNVLSFPRCCDPDSLPDGPDRDRARKISWQTDGADCADIPCSEEHPCSKYIDLKCKELVFLITNFYPLPQLGSFFYPISTYTESFHYFVMQNYSNVKNVEEFAHLGGYTTTTFRRLFKNLYGVPVYEWILEKKREGILEDLQHTKMRITEICNRYGFDSLSHFAHFCKDSFGDTPRALRKKAAGGEKIGKVQ